MLILNTLRGYKIPFITIPYQDRPPENIAYSSESLRKAINILLYKKAIEKCKNYEFRFLSSFFLAQKSDGSDRFILNLKQLNKFIDPKHFKMEDIRLTKIY